jgi:hypothetical protein
MAEMTSGARSAPPREDVFAASLNANPLDDAIQDQSQSAGLLSVLMAGGVPKGNCVHGTGFNAMCAANRATGGHLPVFQHAGADAFLEDVRVVDLQEGEKMIRRGIADTVGDRQFRIVIEGVFNHAMDLMDGMTNIGTARVANRAVADGIDATIMQTNCEWVVVFWFTCWSNPNMHEVGEFLREMRRFKVLIVVVTVYPVAPKGPKYFHNYSQYSKVVIIRNGVEAPICGMPFRLLLWSLQGRNGSDQLAAALKAAGVFLEPRVASLDVVFTGEGECPLTIGDVFGDLTGAAFGEDARVWGRNYLSLNAMSNSVDVAVSSLTAAKEALPPVGSFEGGDMTFGTAASSIDSATQAFDVAKSAADPHDLKKGAVGPESLSLENALGNRKRALAALEGASAAMTAVSIAGVKCRGAGSLLGDRSAMLALITEASECVVKASQALGAVKEVLKILLSESDDSRRALTVAEIEELEAQSCVHAGPRDASDSGLYAEEGDGVPWEMKTAKEQLTAIFRRFGVVPPHFDPRALRPNEGMNVEEPAAWEEVAIRFSSRTCARHPRSAPSLGTCCTSTRRVSTRERR